MKNKILMFLIFALIMAACQPAVSPDPVQIKQLTQNKSFYSQEWGAHKYEDGVIIFISEKEDFFVVTGIPLLKVDEIADNEFIIVRADSKHLEIGNVVTVTSSVKHQNSTLDSGERVDIYYLDPWINNVEVTGQVDIEDPDFEMLIEAIRQEIANDNLTTFIIIWFFFLNPASPISPFNNSWND